MNPKRFLSLVCLLSLPSLAFAGGQKPGSLLVYPKYTNSDATITVLTVTNTSRTESVRAHFLYINGETCQENNALELLTPNDTVSLITGSHSPDTGAGYVYVYARGKSNPAPITFNHLAGSSLILDGMTGSSYGMQPIVFDGMTKPGTSTDLDTDGVRDLDGLEYSQAPEETVIPRFFGQNGMGGINSELVLVNLTGGRAFTTSINFLIYNDNEEVFSREYSFNCWDRVALTSISGVFDNMFLHNMTNDDPQEILGANVLESGWIWIRGKIAQSVNTAITSPAVYAVLIERIGNKGASDLPFERGKNGNGDLFPLGNFGDTVQTCNN